MKKSFSADFAALRDDLAIFEALDVYKKGNRTTLEK